ncbi:MAG: ATP-dependent DNA helicase RecQ [Saprospiraceae bacterium]
MIDPLHILKQYWCYSAFRPLQKQIIDEVLLRKDVLALLPTGGGKSLCYQVPSLCFEGVTIVISPLIALMKDQVARLKQLNIPCDAIYSGLGHKQIDRILDNARFGTTKLLYVSPERLKTEIFQARVVNMNVNFIAVDEAHCISQWGHDFRPAYLDIISLRDLLPNVPVIALTATATPEVSREIIERLALKDVAVFRDSFARPNLRYHVIPREDQLPYIERMLVKSSGSSIIYVRHRRLCRDLSDWLKTKGISAGAYHGGMEMKERDFIQEAWIKNDTRVIVATNAFGMGVDKSDVRLVVHFDLPPGIEEYYQEAGRAGRDGQESYCIVVVKPSSVKNLVQKVESSFPDIEELRRIYRSLHIYLDLAVGSGQGETFDFNFSGFISGFGLKSSETFQALDIIAKDGWFVIDEAAMRGSTVQITTDQETLHYHQISDSKMDHLTKALLRGYEGLWSAPVHIQENRLARFLNWDEKEVIQLLNKLKDQGLIEYSRSNSKNQITLLRERVPEQNFNIDMKSYLFRKEKAISRMKTMIAYLGEEVECREIFIRKYFGENTTAPCGHCDRCLQKEKQNVSWLENITHILKEHDGITVKDFLAQYKTEQQVSVKKELRQLADENKIRIVEDKIYRRK